MYKAKIFMNGKSQAVRLPKEFRFNTEEVNIIPLGKGIILQPILKTWQEAFDTIIPTEDFFPNGREKLLPQEREWESFK